MSEGRWSLGVDIGGTFTDVVMIDDIGRVVAVKRLTTPERPVDGVVAAIDAALETAGAVPAQVGRLVHATTLATNLVLERAGAVVAYLTTGGFGDLLVIGHDRRGDAQKYDLRHRKPAPLVPRSRTGELAERVDAYGEIVLPLDEDQARAEIARVITPDVEAVAICLLHAFSNPRHELLAARWVADHAPDLPVLLSHEVWPEHRELPRANTTVVSAYVAPTIRRYLGELEQRLNERGFRAEVEVMLSNGGIAPVPEVVRRPIQLMESGPAAGVIAAAHLARACHEPDVISFDMGGTTAKAGVVRAAEPAITTDFVVGGQASVGLKRVATGYPIKLPVIDLAEVGAGGGSIARVDEGGALRVGPESAGADPGPACYGRGGTLPTVTDADLLLGYLNPADFAGGGLRIDPDRAWNAMKTRVADPLGLDILEAAAGIHEIVNATMASAIRVVTLERGLDPRRFTLVASGGAGPVHAARLAQQFGIERVRIGGRPGVGSAIGLLAAEPRADVVATRLVSEEGTGVEALDALYAGLTRAALERLGHDASSTPPPPAVLQRRIDARFRHQAHDLTVPLDDGPIDRACLSRAADRYRALYEERYGVAPDEPVEFVGHRVIATRPARGLPLESPHARPAARSRSRSTTRRAWFAETGEVDVPVFERSELPANTPIEGPALVVEPSSTTVVPPRWRATLEEQGSLLLTRE
jgi:N-methylhydantoinase A